MKEYLAQIKEPPDFTYQIYFIHEPTIFYLLEACVNCSLIGLNDFHLRINNQHLYISTKINDQIYLSLDQMKIYKSALDKIHKKKENFHSITIFYFLEHPGLSRIDDFFPDAIINSKEWFIYYLPEINVNHLNISAKPLDQLFKPFSQCLYDQTHYQKIVQEEAISQNKHFLTLHRNDDIQNFQDIIQYSSIQTIQNQKKNFERILSNISLDFLYPIRKVAVLKGEYTGALSVCVDKLNAKPLRDILQQIHDYDHNAIFKSIFNAFETLYQMDIKRSEQRGIVKYIETLIPVTLEITYLETPFVSSNEPVSQIQLTDIPNMTYHKEAMTMKLLDIIPHFKNKNQYTMVFGLNVQFNNDVSLCRVAYSSQSSMWRENFSVAGITIGKCYELKNIKFENCFSYFNDIRAAINDTYDWEKVKDCLQLNANPADIFHNSELFEKMTDDYFSLAHGNIQLDNVLILPQAKKAKLIDLSFMDNGFPMAFDMVALEMEIKKNIIANHLLINLFKTQKKQFIDILVDIEKSINSEDHNIDIKQSKANLDKWSITRIKQMIEIILHIRQQAYKRYEQSTQNQSTVRQCYRQQLLFYSIRIVEHSCNFTPAHYYAAISSILTASTFFETQKYQNNLKQYLKSSQKKIFISYSHKDKEWLESKLCPLLNVLRHKKIDYWYDINIKTGEKWDPKIRNEIEQASLFICLITDNFLQSEYIRVKEIPAMLNRNVPIFPILLKQCMWDLLDWLKETQIFPKECKPLDQFDPEEQETLIKMIVRDIVKNFIKES